MAEEDRSMKLNRALALQGEYIGMIQIQTELIGMVNKVNGIVNKKQAEYEKLKKEVM